MINVEVKGIIPKENNFEIATWSCFSGLTNESSFDSFELREPFSKELLNNGGDIYPYIYLDNYYINLDKVCSFSFGKTTVESSFRINNKTGIEYNFEYETMGIPKGTPYIKLDFRNFNQYDTRTLIFTHDGEYQRIKRILTEKFCAK